MRVGEKDPGLYDFRPWRDRAPIAWPDGKTCAVWVSPNLEYYELDPPANPHRASWPTPNPSVVGYSHRDHANRDDRLDRRMLRVHRAAGFEPVQARDAVGGVLASERRAGA